MTTVLAERVRQVWAGLAGVPVESFSARLPHVVAPASSTLCPPGRVGLVTVQGAVLATAPSQEAADQVGEALRACSPLQVTDPAVVSALLPVAEVLGPAWLSYPGPGDLALPPPGGPPVEHLTAAHPEPRDLLEAATEDEAAESALEDITSGVFVVRHGGALVAAAGYQRWPLEVAHPGVLTAAPTRGRGLAGATAHAAVQDALARGLLPQWRARPDPSRRVAARLGLQELGQQLSIRLDPR